MNKQIVIIVSFCLILLLGIGLVWPRYQELKFLEQKIERKTAEVLKREKDLGHLKKTAQTLENYQTQLAKVDSALPSNPELSALFDFIQKTGAQSGLVLKSISYNPPQPFPGSEDFKETEASLAVSGVYPSFKNFLSVLEQSARLIEIESISFLASPEEEFRDFDLKIKVYSY